MKLPSKILRQIPDLPFLAFHQIIGILSKLLPTLLRQTSHTYTLNKWPVFQSNLGKLVPEWRTIQNFNGATGDTNWNSYYAQSTSQVIITIIPTQAITGWMLLFLSPN